jgi:hypothetical protein
MDAARAELIAAVNMRFDALTASADALLAGQLATLRAQGKRIELHMDAVAHAITFARDVATHGTDSEVGVTHATTLARLAGAKNEHAAVPWTPACEGPARTVLATRDEHAAWLARTCKLVAAKEVEQAAVAAARKRAENAAAAAAAAAAEKKRADDAAAAETAALRVRGACAAASFVCCSF